MTRQTFVSARSRVSRVALVVSLAGAGLVGLSAVPAAADDCAFTQVESSPGVSEFASQSDLQTILDSGCLGGGTLRVNFTVGFPEGNPLTAALAWAHVDPLIFQPATADDHPVLYGSGTDSIVTDAGDAGQLTIDGLTLTHGGPDGSGGAIAWGASGVTLHDAVLTENSATSDGGAVSSGGAVTVLSSTVSDNTAGSGGGGISSNNDVTVMNSTLSGNTASGGTGGGGIFTNASATVSQSTISDNHANNGTGGGIWASQTATVTNSTISGNTTGTAGGGIFTSNDAVTVNFSSVVQNTSTVEGSEVYAEKALVATASVFGAASSTSSCRAGEGMSGDYNANVTGDNCTFTGTGNVSSSWAAMKLPALANNGGPTLTRMPTAGSTLIQVVPDTVGSGLLPPVTTDQRAVTRTGTLWWIGAAQGTVTPTPPSRKAQTPAKGCVVLGTSTSIPRRGTRVLTGRHCVTNAGQIVGTRVISAQRRTEARGDYRTATLFCKVGHKIRGTSATGYGPGSRYCKTGLLMIRTYGARLTLLVQWHAPANSSYRAYTQTKTYKT